MDPNAIFDFEPRETHDLSWIALAVRYKLDLCGLRLSLAQWQALAPELRRQLVTAPINSGAERKQFMAMLGQEVVSLAPATATATPHAVNISARGELPPADVAARLEALVPPLLTGDMTRRWQEANDFERYLVVKVAGSRMDASARDAALRSLFWSGAR